MTPVDLIKKISLWLTMSGVVVSTSPINIKAMGRCDPCPPGHRVVSYCEGTNQPTVCEPCPLGTYSNQSNNLTVCTRCQRCKRREIIESHCTKSSDTTCKCKPGFIYNPHRPCTPCPKGYTARNNNCVNGTEIDPGGTNTDNDVFEMVGGMAAGFLLAFVLLVIFVCCFFRRRKRLLEKNVNKPDVLKDIEVKTTPPLPPKKCPRRQNENDYTANPMMGRPIVPRKLTLQQVSFEVVQEMEIMLSKNYSKNYKHLAGKLGLSYSTVKTIEAQPHPVETLLGYYISGENATRERLVEALVSIERNDVAELAWHSL